MDGTGKHEVKNALHKVLCFLTRIYLVCDRDFGSKRGYPNESEYTIVKVDFYNDIKRYLAELDNTNIRSLEDIVEYVACICFNSHLIQFSDAILGSDLIFGE